MKWAISPLYGCHAHLLLSDPPRGVRKGFCGHLLPLSAVEYAEEPCGVPACPACTEIYALAELLAVAVLECRRSYDSHLEALVGVAMKHEAVRQALRVDKTAAGT